MNAGPKQMIDARSCGFLLGRRSPRLAFCPNGLGALIGVLSVIAVAGCSSQSGDHARVSTAYLPSGFRLFGARPALPKELSTVLPAAISSRFAIFRREMLSNDQPFATTTSRELTRQLYADYELASFYPAYVRRLTGSFGRSGMSR
jgi:hypothetical protein